MASTVRPQSVRPEPVVLTAKQPAPQPSVPPQEPDPVKPAAPVQAKQPSTPAEPPAPPVKSAFGPRKRRPSGADEQPPELVIRQTAGGVGRGGSLTVEQQKRVNEAIDRGVTYIRTTQIKGGSWLKGQYGVGYAALPGLTLLECGARPTDPTVQRAARFVRFNAATLNRTYELSLAILFLDRLGNPKDRKLIQTLAMRLVAGQNSAGGWTYLCPILKSNEYHKLLTFLRNHQPRHLQEPIAQAKPGKLSDPLAISPKTPLSDPIADPHKKPSNLSEPITGSPKGKPSGESKLGQSLPPRTGPKPEAKPHPQPVAKGKKKATAPTKVATLRLDFLPLSMRTLPVVQKAAHQGKVKGRFGFMSGRDDNSNTQFAIMALWAARRHYVPVEWTLALVKDRFHNSQRPSGGWNYQFHGDGQTGPMTCVGLIGLAVGHGSAQLARKPETAPGQAIVQDAAITQGLEALGRYLPQPAGTQTLYFLWSLERVGVLYNLKTIGNTNWYLWGVECLLPIQQSDGSWFAHGYPGSSATLDTCMALLFLKRANLTRDLSEHIRLYMAIVDPDVRPASSKR